MSTAAFAQKETESISEKGARITETFRDGIYKIASIYVIKYQQDPEGCLRFLKNSEVPVQILNMVYNSLKDEIGKIEDLPLDEKRELWNLSGKNERICKAIYVIQKI